MIRKENIMKKIFLIPLMFLTFLSLTACSPTDDDLIVPETPEQPENPGNGNSDDNDPEEPTDPIPGGNGRYLVLFTSRSGNTERVANEIRDQLDCDILEVESETAFETDYNAMLERARDELNAIQQGNFPAVKTSMEDFDSYDLVFVGYPIWYGSDPELELEGVTRGCAPVPGDITIYVPWGNLAIFCKNWSSSNDLVRIGHIDGNGIEALNVPGDISVRLEKR